MMKATRRPAEWASFPFWRKIAMRNETHIRSCQAVIANLTPFRGPSADVGTVYEVGFARALGLLIFGVAWASWRAWRAPAELTQHLLWLVLWFLFVANPWFQPWYVIWPLALVALQPGRARAVLVVNVFCLTALIGYVVGGFLPALGLNERSAVREMGMSVVLYLPPLLVFGWDELVLPLLRWRGARPADESHPVSVAVQE